ncbi:amidohydrolase [Sporosarcina sp. Sa2YVA2]|uniref:Amidohydrolase n=1 Tax=Sporosarcina quadrami TaxID=2762234 RepID=A0ABR8U952_9BACL|nr:amidohydrolase [Sporosarcina quadrami]MBD7984545.1 amidohydrolase [Sporosarcina quadrami]
MYNKLTTLLAQQYTEMVGIRRDFHMHPELSFQEVRTPKIIVNYLEDLGINVRIDVGKHGGGCGVVGTLKGVAPGPTIAFRADFDALPITDQKDVAYKSTVDGVMHACGHDIHTAALLGVAKVLASFQKELHGTVVFVFQFAEEADAGGAKPMIEDGCLDGVDKIYGAHVWSELPIGTVGVRDGAAMASYDGFEITIIGSGGHGAKPYETIDPIVLGSQLVINLQTIVSRRVNPVDPAVVTIGSFHSGSAGSIIPDTSEIVGTVRTFNPEVRKQIEKEIYLIVKATCDLAGATFKLNYVHGYPVLQNDSEAVKDVQTVVSERLTDYQLLDMDMVLAAEDFAYYLQQKPGAFFFVGGRNEQLNAIYPHHHAKFDVDEKSLLIIGDVFLGLVVANGLLGNNSA